MMLLAMIVYIALSTDIYAFSALYDENIFRNGLAYKV
jgi:hypothetical protein